MVSLAQAALLQGISELRQFTAPICRASTCKCLNWTECVQRRHWSEWVCGPLQRDDEVGTCFCGGLSPKDRLTLGSLPAPPRESLVRINEDLHQLDHETFGMRTTSADGWMAEDTLAVFMDMSLTVGGWSQAVAGGPLPKDLLVHCRGPRLFTFQTAPVPQKRT